ncbi:hypothetical protein L3Q82_015338, partial [Scortum barcoo]
MLKERRPEARPALWGRVDETTLVLELADARVSLNGIKSPQQVQHVVKTLKHIDGLDFESTLRYEWKVRACVGGKQQKIKKRQRKGEVVVKFSCSEASVSYYSSAREASSNLDTHRLPTHTPPPQRGGASFRGSTSSSSSSNRCASSSSFPRSRPDDPPQASGTLGNLPRGLEETDVE